jgi:hypothetical protein
MEWIVQANIMNPLRAAYPGQLSDAAHSDIKSCRSARRQTAASPNTHSPVFMPTLKTIGQPDAKQLFQLDARFRAGNFS